MKNLKDILNEAFLIKKHQSKVSHEYVDLDLPSGNLWATCNIGANKPQELGLLFQWGCTDGYKYDDKNNKFLFKNDYNTVFGTKYKKGDVLKTEDDAAYQATKGEYRMPTVEEIDELIKHTDNEWVELKGINGRKFISKKDKSKWIFIPAAGACDPWSHDFTWEGSYGYIWSSSCDSSLIARGLQVFSRNCNTTFNERLYGFSVRGVLNK